MRSIWIVLVIGLATGYLSEKLLVSSQMSPASDDMYLEGQSSGSFPLDDEDDKDNFSGSGSSEFYPTETIEKWNMTTVTQEGTWNATLESTSSPTMMQADTTTKYIIQTEVTGLEPSDENELAETLPPSTTDCLFPTTYNVETSTGSGDVSLEDVILPGVRNKVLLDAGPRDRIQVDAPEEVTSEGMWQRTDVLAAVIACGVVGFLCALFLVLLLAYRMKKKDEGSYALGVAKVPPSAYQKQPPKEFYA
ncbi:unnamed protein product [Lota lota]